MTKEAKKETTEKPGDLSHLPQRVRDRILRGDAFGPPRSRRPKVNVREFVERLQGS